MGSFRAILLDGWRRYRTIQPTPSIGAASRAAGAGSAIVVIESCKEGKGHSTLVKEGIFLANHGGHCPDSILMREEELLATSKAAGLRLHRKEAFTAIHRLRSRGSWIGSVLPIRLDGLLQHESEIIVECASGALQAMKAAPSNLQIATARGITRARSCQCFIQG